MADMAQELKDMAAFYLERPSIDEERYTPRMCEISNRERKAIASMLLRAATAMPDHSGMFLPALQSNHRAAHPHTGDNT